MTELDSQIFEGTFFSSFLFFFFDKNPVRIYTKTKRMRESNLIGYVH